LCEWVGKLKRNPRAGAVAVLMALLAWFGVELLTGGGLAGRMRSAGMQVP